jgi:T-complex protein 1 subunit gamma
LIESLSLFSRSDLACKIALEATKIVSLEEHGRKEIDIKRYAKVEKVSMLGG